MLAMAQEDPEYRAEIGGGIGLVSYQGDLNGNILKNMQPMFSLVAKYKPNPRMAWAFNLSFGNIKGTGKNLKTWYPEYQGKEMEFKNSLVDVTLK